jgi:hypothetical protein
MNALKRARFHGCEFIYFALMLAVVAIGGGLALRFS